MERNELSKQLYQKDTSAESKSPSWTRRQWNRTPMDQVKRKV